MNKDIKYWYKYLKPVEVIDDTEEAADKFGWNYGGGVCYITLEQLEEFRKGGKLMAIDINGGEYVQFIKLEDKS